MYAFFEDRVVPGLFSTKVRQQPQDIVVPKQQMGFAHQGHGCPLRLVRTSKPRDSGALTNESGLRSTSVNRPGGRAEVRVGASAPQGSR